MSLVVRRPHSGAGGGGGSGDVGGRDRRDGQVQSVVPRTVVGAVVGALQLCRRLCCGKINVLYLRPRFNLEGHNQGETQVIKSQVKKKKSDSLVTLHTTYGREHEAEPSEKAEIRKA